MKKYLFIALAALGFAACTEKGEDNAPIQNAELEESYIAINLMAADSDTRATDGGFDYGTDNEREIHNAHFFFFKDGEPFVVNATDAPATAPGGVGSQNHLQLSIENVDSSTADPAVNISDISEAVLVLSTYKGEYPNQIVAVLNWVPTQGKTYTLTELREELYENSLGNDTNGYVMSNSVYMNNAYQVVDVTPITADNIKTSPELAVANPVNIYVERTAAKVVVTTDEDAYRFTVTDENGMKPVGAAARKVYVELLGWELYNEFTKTNLIKQINTTWNSANEGLGLTWNDQPKYRSYWATTMNTRTENDTFAWSYTQDGTTTYGHEIGSCTYCAENTLDWTTNDVRTKVILKGRLVEKVGDNYQAIELARWYGNEYAGVGDLKTAVANSLKYTIYYLDTASGKYVSIAPEHIEVVHGDVVGAKPYEVGFQLTTDAQSLPWHKYSSADGYQPFGDIADGATKTNEYLTSVKPAVLYKGGDTYYIVDIEHLGTTGAKYGVVRNHVYHLDIESIKGYGSPGYSGFSHIVEQPEYPKDEDESSYVAAKINVLSWKVVKQGVNIEQ